MVAEVESISGAETESQDEDEGGISAPQSQAERAGIIEALIFVSDEPLTVKVIADVLKEDRAVVEESVRALAEEFNARNGGLQLREVAGGWQFATRPEYHEYVRRFCGRVPVPNLLLHRWKRWR